MIKRWYGSFFVVVTLLTVQGCAPSIVPLYRDYETASTGDSVYAQIREALVESDWELSENRYGESVISTEEKSLQNFGIYKTSARIDVAQVNGGYVRVYVHPFRKYLISGRRSKIPYLDRRMRRQVVAPLNDALAARGIQIRGSALEREEKTR